MLNNKNYTQIQKHRLSVLAFPTATLISWLSTVMLWDPDTDKEKDKERAVGNLLHGTLQRIRENSLFSLSLFLANALIMCEWTVHLLITHLYQTGYIQNACAIAFPTAGQPDPLQTALGSTFLVPQSLLTCDAWSPPYLGLFSKTGFHASVLTLRWHRLSGAASGEGQQDIHLGLGWFYSHPAPAPGNRTRYFKQGHTYRQAGKSGQRPRGISWVVAAQLIPLRSRADWPQEGDVRLRVFHHLRQGLE